MVAVLVLSFVAVALPMSVAAQAPVLWQNGAYGLFGYSSEENTTVNGDGSPWILSSRVADDFQLPAGCPWYNIESIRGQMVLSGDNVPPDAHVEIYADSGGNGPVEAAPLYTSPMSSYADLGSAGLGGPYFEYWKLYEFTFETADLSLPPGHHWLSLYNQDAAHSAPYQAFFAMTALNAGHQLQPAYTKNSKALQTSWIAEIHERDAVFEIDGYCGYPFAGFFSPVDNPPTVIVVKAGSAVPVKFSLGGDEGLDIFLAGYPMSQKVACDTGAPQDLVEETDPPAAAACSTTR